jgi:hypothetical protein
MDSITLKISFAKPHCQPDTNVRPQRTLADAGSGKPAVKKHSG